MDCLFFLLLLILAVPIVRVLVWWVKETWNDPPIWKR